METLPWVEGTEGTKGTATEITETTGLQEERSNGATEKRMWHEKNVTPFLRGSVSRCDPVVSVAVTSVYSVRGCFHLLHQVASSRPRVSHHSSRAARSTPRTAS